MISETIADIKYVEVYTQRAFRPVPFAQIVSMVPYKIQGGMI